jgi:hypothetical protein
MITGQRIDEYVTRIAEVKAELERRSWTAIRHDEWASPLGDTIRFSYAHLEFRVYTNYIGTDRRPETHVIHVREADKAHVPTVEEILTDILDINLAAWNPRHGAYAQATRSNGVASKPQA